MGVGDEGTSAATVVSWLDVPEFCTEPFVAVPGFCPGSTALAVPGFCPVRVGLPTSSSQVTELRRGRTPDDEDDEEEEEEEEEDNPPPVLARPFLPTTALPPRGRGVAFIDCIRSMLVLVLEMMSCLLCPLPFPFTGPSPSPCP